LYTKGPAGVAVVVEVGVRVGGSVEVAVGVLVGVGVKVAVAVFVGVGVLVDRKARGWFDPVARKIKTAAITISSTAAPPNMMGAFCAMLWRLR